MAGTLTITHSKLGALRSIIVNWTSTSGGVADNTTTFKVRGTLIKAVTNPDDVAFPQNNVANSTLFMLSLSTVTSESITGITDTLSNTWAQVYDETKGTFRLEI